MKSKRLYYINKISEVFLQNGINSLTVDMIAGKIGVTKKTLYNYLSALDYSSP